jgi:GH25 family lysozyme M1 (1,4-beta-N-acetylmuramidase)
VTCGNKTGYVKAQYIKKGNPPVASAAPAPTPQPAASDNTTQDQNQSQNQNQNQTTQPAPQPVQLDYSPVANFTAYIGSDQLKVFQGPDSNSGVVTTLREKTAVTIIGQNGDWMKIRSNDGKEGFVYKDNLTTDLNRFDPPAGAYGVDISHYQNENSGGTIDFNAIKNSGKSFVIVKATEGETQSTVKQKNTQGETSDQQWTDYTFNSNAKRATDVGLKVHAYHFFRANSVNDAIIEADHFADILNAAIANGANIDYVYVDVETTNGIQNDIKTNLSNNVNAFLKEMRARGFNKLGIYSGLSFYKSYISTSLIEQPQGNPRLLVWIARYRGQDTNSGIGADIQVDIWQYTSNGSVNGVNGAVDLNVSYYNPDAM